MSLGKITDVVKLGEAFEGLTPEQIKEKISQKFSEAFGRYESTSGKMWVEVYHNEGDKTAGNIIWRKGTEGKDELDEDLILDLPEALSRFYVLMNRGYTCVFRGVTQSDMDKGNDLRITKQSKPQREGWLGTYHKGSRFFRINQFKANEYYVEYGYDGMTTRTSVENESGARFELDMALAEGFAREGSEEAEFVNPLEAFGLELDSIEADEYREQNKHKVVDGELPDDFFEMMK